MKKILFFVFALLLATPCAFCEESVFDSSDKAIEVKLAPSITEEEQTASSNTQIAPISSQVQEEVQTDSVYKPSIKEEKFNEALTNLDDAQVELREELSEVSAQYEQALAEKEKALLNCKNLKSEIKDLNKKMKNIEKSKKMINKNIETTN